MTHPRRVIREYVASMLQAAGTACEARVWASREAPINVEAVLMEQGPVMLIYTRHDRKAKDGDTGQGYGSQKRDCDLHIEITASGALIVDDQLDDIAEGVEELMDNIAIPGMPATEIRFVDCVIMTSDDFEQPIGGILFTYEACYWRTWRVDPEDEPPFFPTQVRANGDVVADCTTCDECPDGGQQ